MLYSFVDVRALHRAGKPEQCSIVAEGFLDGKIVARTKNMPSKRNEQLVLTVDSGLPPACQWFGYGHGDCFHYR